MALFAEYTGMMYYNGTSHIPKFIFNHEKNTIKPNANLNLYSYLCGIRRLQSTVYASQKVTIFNIQRLTIGTISTLKIECSTHSYPF